MAGQLADPAGVHCSWCPLKMEVERIECHLSGTPLTEQLLDCWHGFYARVILTFRGLPILLCFPLGSCGPLFISTMSQSVLGLASTWFTSLVVRPCCSPTLSRQRAMICNGLTGCLWQCKPLCCFFDLLPFDYCECMTPYGLRCRFALWELFILL